MRRYGLHDDQWERIKDLLAGQKGHVGGTAADNRLFMEAVLYRYRAGIPYRDLSTGSVTGKTHIVFCADGAKVVLSKGYFVTWWQITITNT